MNHPLDNPVFESLCTGDAHLGLGTKDVKYFPEDVSPFVGIRHGNANGFSELFSLLAAGRKILHATPFPFSLPRGWRMLQAVEGVQMVYRGSRENLQVSTDLVALEDHHVEEMVELARLTKPGPFGRGTKRFGYYYGIFDNGKLVAMTGQRLHVRDHTEISAVCTHPDHLGKGHAFALVQHQANLILEQGNVPFLHVRADNRRAIQLYERAGFVLRGPMNFYFMAKGREGEL